MTSEEILSIFTMNYVGKIVNFTGRKMISSYAREDMLKNREPQK